MRSSLEIDIVLSIFRLLRVLMDCYLKIPLARDDTGLVEPIKSLLADMFYVMRCTEWFSKSESINW